MSSITRRGSALLIAATIVWLPVGAPLAAQTAQPTAAPPAGPNPAWYARNLTRVESWRFFEPPAGGGDPDYAHVGNRLLAGVRYAVPRLELNGSLQYVQFGGLPTNAFGPGGLGTGAAYFDHGGRTDSRGVYVKLLNAQVRQVLPGLDLRVGRMGYASGAESPSGDAGVEAVKRLRLDSRLVGEFEWSLYQRSFDGIRADWLRRSVQATFSALWPTQGGFEPRAGRSLRDVRLLGTTVSLRPGPGRQHTDVQGFLWNYRDTRVVTARPDPTGRSVTAADVGITTLGGHLVGAYPSAAGRTDVLWWLAIQGGEWYELDHSAWAIALEAGHQWSARPGRPWLRGGWNRASGSDRPLEVHGTFFPMAPTARRYALSTVYSFMNLDDLFGQVLLRPLPQVGIRADVHRLRLAEAADLWYAGSGATRRAGVPFGYAGRRSGGSRQLGTIVEGSIDWTVHRRWSINAYAGRMAGGDVVRASFAGDRLTFAYVENVIQFP